MKLLALLIISGAILSADPVAIMWTGAPSISGSSCPGCGNSSTLASFTSGDTAILDAWGPATYAQAWGVESGFYVSDQFTIASPALINVAATMTYNVDGEACPANGCALASFDLTGQFSGSVGIIDADNSLFIPLSATGDTEIPCDSGCGVGGIAISDTESGEVFLDAGVYTVVVSMSDSTNVGGDSMTGSGFQGVFTDPVGVPEPRMSIRWLAVGLLGFWECRKRRIKTRI